MGVSMGLAAIAIAVAFIVIGSGGDKGTPDRFTISANRLCRTARQEVTLAARRYRAAFYKGDPTELARSFFTAVGKLQSSLNTLEVSHEKLRPEVELHEAIFEWEVPLVSLIHLQTSERHLVKVRGRELESINVGVHETASALGLDECARLRLGMPPLPS
jgi:hypothetical protein